MSFPKYSRYAETGAEWISKIPEHWSFMPTKALFRDRNERASENEPQLTASQKHGVIPQALFAQLEQVRVMQVVTGRDILKQARKGDFVISMRSFQGGLEYCPYDGAVSSAYVPIYSINRNVEYGYFKYFFKESTFIKALQQTSNLVRDGQALRFSNLTQVRLPLPTSSEQTQIARFLDHETAKIDALIAEQKRLIKLLQEKRQAVISHAVTKGLDPNVPMKDSGVEWLGEVPAHWKVRKLSHLTSKIGSGKTPKGGALSYVDSGIKLIRSQNVYDEGLRLADIAYIAPEVDDEMYWSRVQAGDILLNITGGSIGRTCTVSESELPANVNQHVCIIRLGDVWKDHLDWVSLFLRSALIKEQINFNQTGSGREGLNFEQLSNFRVPVPPLAEAQNIAKQLMDGLSAIEQLNSHAFLCSDLLKERRSALISAAVTGKIDVRDWQPPGDESAFNEEVQKAGMEVSA